MYMVHDVHVNTCILVSSVVYVHDCLNFATILAEVSTEVHTSGSPFIQEATW